MNKARKLHLARVSSAFFFLCWHVHGSAQQVDLMDDDVLTMLAFDELEWSGFGDDATLSWDGDFWVGTDIDRVWLKTKGERVEGSTEHSDFELLYSRALKPFWNLQGGWRHDSRPTPDQNWAAISILGLAPYWFEVEASLYIAEGGQRSLSVETDYELLLTQRLILEPSAELTAYADTDSARGIGSGLAEFELGVRLRYEIKREFAPYIGITWNRRFGATADFAELAGQATDDWEAVIGIKFWY